MENKFLTNKIILRNCKDYYRIINEEFSENDTMTSKVIQVYQNYIFSIDVKNKQKMSFIKKLNDAIVKYFDDNEFKKNLSVFLKNLKVSQNETNIIEYISQNIVKEYERYMEGYTRSIYISKWI